MPCVVTSLVLGLTLVGAFTVIPTRRYHRSSISVLRETITAADADVFDTFSDEVWNLYHERMGILMKLPRVVKKAKPDVTGAVQEYLLSRSVAVSRLPTLDTDNLADVLLEQRSLFCRELNFTDEQLGYCSRCLAYLGDQSAKSGDADPLRVAWSKFRETGIHPRERFLSTYMYVLADEAEVAIVHDGLYAPNEKTVYLRIKTLVGNGRVTEAEELLKSIQDTRLRTFQPVVEHYAEHRDMLALLRLLKDMREADGVVLDSETYAIIVATIAREGRFLVDAPVIDGANQLGFSSGPQLFDELATLMSEDLLELSNAAAATIYAAFVAGFPSDECPPEDLAPCQSLRRGPLVGRVSIDPSSGTCPLTDVKLRLISLNEDQRDHVKQTLFDMSVTQHEEFTEKLRTKGEKTGGRGDSARAREKLQEFVEWLENRDGPPFTAIVDGPNVAYAGHGDVHYSQVLLVVEELERLGERPLVIMPSKYVSKQFYVTGLGGVQTLGQKDLDTMHGLLSAGKMYCVPPSCLDDYYWMIASVANQKSEVTVQPDADDQRFPGLRPYLVTNDQMRDHKLALLQARLFRRWTSCYIVRRLFAGAPKPVQQSSHVVLSGQLLLASIRRLRVGHPRSAPLSCRLLQS